MAKIKIQRNSNDTCDDCKYYSTGFCSKWYIPVASYDPACTEFKGDGKWI